MSPLSASAGHSNVLCVYSELVAISDFLLLLRIQA